MTLTGSSLARHVALPDHGVGLDGQSCSCLIVGWPVGLSSPTLGVGHPSVMFLFDCSPVGRPMLRTVRGCYIMGLKVEPSQELFTFVDCSHKGSGGIVRDLEVQIDNACPSFSRFPCLGHQAKLELFSTTWESFLVNNGSSVQLANQPVVSNTHRF